MKTRRKRTVTIEKVLTTGKGQAGYSKAAAVMRARIRDHVLPAPVSVQLQRPLSMPVVVWEELDNEAKRLEMTDADFVRAAIEHWLESNC